MKLEKRTWGYPEVETAIRDLTIRGRIASPPNLLISIELKPYQGMFFIEVIFVTP